MSTSPTNPARVPGSASTTRVVRRRPVVVAVLLGVLAPLVLLEVGLRIWHAAQGTYRLSDETLRQAANCPWRASDDPELVYVHRTDDEVRTKLGIESHGIFQSREVAKVKPPGALRVALVGDSVGAAMYLVPTERMAYLLELRLAAETRRQCEVLNFCVNGYDTLQEARLLETTVEPLAPDAVVLVFCLNDPAVSLTPRAWLREPSAPVSYVAEFVGDVLSRASGRSRGRPVAPEEGPGDPVAAARWRQMYEPDGEGFAVVERGLDRIARWSERTRVPVLVAIAPLILAEDPTGESTAAFRAQVAAAVRARNLAVVDLQECLAKIPHEELRFGPADIYHPGAAAQPPMARTLAPLLLPLVVPVPPK